MLGHISFKWKNSILITIVISIILTVVHSFVYFTFQSWSQKQEGLVLEKEIKQFKAKIEDPRFYGELFTPNFLTQQGPIRKEGWGRELEKGQYLRVETNTGKVIIETENDFPSNLINKLKSEKNLFTVHERVNLPYYGNCLIVYIAFLDQD